MFFRSQVTLLSKTAQETNKGGVQSPQLLNIVVILESKIPFYLGS